MIYTPEIEMELIIGMINEKFWMEGGNEYNFFSKIVSKMDLLWQNFMDISKSTWDRKNLMLYLNSLGCNY